MEKLQNGASSLFPLFSSPFLPSLHLVPSLCSFLPSSSPYTGWMHPMQQMLPLSPACPRLVVQVVAGPKALHPWPNMTKSPPTGPKALCPWPDRSKSPLSLVLSAGRPKQAEAGSGGVPRKSLTKQTTWLEWMWAELGILTQA